MGQVRISDRHTGRDRRSGGASSYTVPERRKLKYRRSGVTAVCIYCRGVCGASTIKTTVRFTCGVCRGKGQRVLKTGVRISHWNHGRLLRFIVRVSQLICCDCYHRFKNPPKSPFKIQPCVKCWDWWHDSITGSVYVISVWIILRMQTASPSPAPPVLWGKHYNKW